MKHSYSHLIMFFVVLAALSLAVSFDPTPGHGQSREGRRTGRVSNAGSRVKPTSAIRERPAGASLESLPATSLQLAAARNASVSRDLKWTFGGKQQRGWRIYEALIRRLLQTEHNAASEGFAAALTSWQKQSGLRPSGVLDEESLNAMVSQWQGKRLKDRGYPRSEDL